jgi:membrane protease YdiL (CAAX protease family)
MNVKFFNIVLWCFPLIIIAIQLLPVEYSFVVGIAFFTFGLTKRFRVFLLFGLTTFGYLFWLFTVQYLTTIVSNAPLLVVLNRLGLVGYIIVFAIWLRIEPCIGYLKKGNMKETLKAPLIWWGNNEYVWRFVLIVCSLWAVPAIVFTFLHGTIIEFMPYALLFVIINPIIEGVVWRSFILGRVVDYIGEKQGLIISSVAFGLYHFSLGFSIWICLLFAIGGFYMGGIAIKSKGFLAPTIVHIFVNLALVSFGIIFQ